MAEVKPKQPVKVDEVEASRMSWCLSDVLELGGPETLRGRYDEWSDEETTVIYPDATPAGVQTARRDQPTGKPSPATPGDGPQLLPLSPDNGRMPD